jgi:UDP-glucuronate 4-epimerase
VTRVISRLIRHIPPDNGAASRIYNIGNNRPEELNHVVSVLEQALGRTAVKEILPMMPPGDVPATFADVGDLMREIGFRPETGIEDGIRNFVAWYREHYEV